MEKTGTRSEVWIYFAYHAYEDCNPKDASKSECKTFNRLVLCKSGNLSKLAKALAEYHPNQFDELKSWQVT